MCIRDRDRDTVVETDDKILSSTETVSYTHLGKAVLCEKPLTMSAREARRLFDLAEACGVPLLEAMWTRYLPAWRRARDLVQEGACLLYTSLLTKRDCRYIITLNTKVSK